MKISGCIITKNEEKNIANCINNLKNITDEIIVVDTGSDDKTIQIAKELGAFVYEHEWEDDFSKAKNTALEYAKGDWIIFLDADEYLHESSQPKVRSIIQHAHSNRSIEGIQCELVNLDTDNDKIIGRMYALRIFRSSKEFRFINKIHEEIRNNGSMLKCMNQCAELSIIHTGYAASVVQRKAERNLELLLRNKEDEKSEYYLAVSYYLMKDYDNAYKFAESALSKHEIYTVDYLAYKMHMIKIAVTISFEFSNKEKIRRLIDEADYKYSNHPEIAATTATYFLKEKQYKKALDKYRHAIECQEKYGRTLKQNDFLKNIAEVYYNIAEILYLMNKDADALDYYVKLLKTNKYHVNGFNSMLKLCRAIPVNDTIVFLNSIYDIGNEEDVKFIISQVSISGRSRLVLYYAAKWNHAFAHEDDVLVYAFISQGNFLKALEIALLYLESNPDAYSPLVTAVLLMGQLFSEAELMRDRIGEEYYQIIECNSTEKKYTGSQKTYLSVLSILVHYIDHYDLTGYLNIVREADINMIQGIAEIFLADLQYEQAIKHFAILFELQSNKSLRAFAAMELGYSYYKLKQYRESVDWFETAVMNGYTENDLADYLCWIVDQSSDIEVKSKAEALTRYSIGH